jgi:hypothetical protein
MTLILVGLLVAGVEALRRQVIREFPDATRADAARRHRERWERVVAASRRRGAAVRDSAARTARSASDAVVTQRDGTHEHRAAASDDEARLQQLERLALLRESGVLDDEELRTEKQRILGATAPANGADRSPTGTPD